MSYPRFLYIRSSRRGEGESPSNFTTAVNVGGQKYYLSHASIPATFYNVSSAGGGRGNKFYFRDTEDRVAELPLGNYSSATLPAALQRAMNFVGAQSYTVTYDPLNRTINISGQRDFSITMHTSTVSGLGGSAAQLTTGFVMDTRDGKSHTSEMSVNFNPISNIGVSVTGNASIIDPGGNTLTFLIPVQIEETKWIHYSPPSTFRQYVVFPEGVENVKVTLYDEYYEEVNLNGVDWTMVLERDYSYRAPVGVAPTPLPVVSDTKEKGEKKEREKTEKAPTIVQQPTSISFTTIPLSSLASVPLPTVVASTPSTVTTSSVPLTSGPKTKLEPTSISVLPDD